MRPAALATLVQCAVLVCGCAIAPVSLRSAPGYGQDRRVDDGEDSIAEVSTEAPRRCRDDSAGEDDDYKWTFTVYNAWGTEQGIGDLFTGEVSIVEDDTVSAVAVGRRIGESEPLTFIGIDWPILYGVEAVVGSRNDEARDDPYLEYVLSVTTRYEDFPWEETVRTFLEGGYGLSYAEEIPQIEIERRGDKVNQLLAYLKIELGMGIPHTPWDLVGLLHHRSGAWGLFDGASGGSNFLGLGIQARF